jgi:hypothetical protein
MQVGYSRKSDESVSSGWWEGVEAQHHLEGLMDDPDVVGVWIRTTPEGRAFTLKKNGRDLDGPRFLSMPDPPGTTRIAEIRKRLHGE